MSSLGDYFTHFACIFAKSDIFRNNHRYSCNNNKLLLRQIYVLVEAITRPGNSLVLVKTMTKMLLIAADYLFCFARLVKIEEHHHHHGFYIGNRNNQKNELESFQFCNAGALFIANEWLWPTKTKQWAQESERSSIFPSVVTVVNDSFIIVVPLQGIQPRGYTLLRNTTGWLVGLFLQKRRSFVSAEASLYGSYFRFRCLQSHD